MDAGVSFAGALLRGRAELRYSRNLRIFEGGEISNYVRSPITVADYTKIHGIVTTLSGTADKRRAHHLAAEHHLTRIKENQSGARWDGRT